MSPTRRSVLLGAGGLGVAGGIAPTVKTGIEVLTMLDNSVGDGVALAVGFQENLWPTGRSKQVAVRGSDDPATGEDDEAEVLHITSLPPGQRKGKSPGESKGKGKKKGHEKGADPDGPGVTLDYGVSLVDVRARDLTLHDFAADGLAYDWYTTDQDVVGVGRDHGQAGISGGPDEVWFVLEGVDGGSSDTSGMGRLLAGEYTLVFRTLYADEPTGEWHTRTVSDELQAEGNPPWRKLSVNQRQFVDVGTDLLGKYGDANVLALAVGRGDPFWGPSVLDTYYRNLEVAGETYRLPVAGRGPPGRGQ